MGADPKNGTSCQISSSTETQMKSKNKKKTSKKPLLMNKTTPLPLMPLKTSKANKTGMANKLTTQPVKPKTGPLNQLLKLKIGPLKPVLVTRTGLKLMPDKVGKLTKFDNLIFNAKFIF